MLYQHLIFIFLSFYNMILVEFINANQKKDDTIAIIPSNIPKSEKNLKTQNTIEQKANTHIIKDINNFTDYEIEEMELIFEQSPQEAQDIVNHLQDNTFFPHNENYRSAIFFGEPGSGKTMMAKAIAYKMVQQGWKYKHISSAALLGEYRNQTAIKLQKELEITEVSAEPTIIVIDELNRLLENAESKHHDTDMTATALWTFLDQQKGNKNFFLIGTMNRVHKLPKPYKSRILFDCIYFPAMHSTDIKNKAFRAILAKKSQLDPEVTDVFLNQQLEKIGECTGRDLQNIFQALCRSERNRAHQNTPLCITKTSIAEVIDKYIYVKTKMEYNQEEETDEERQERYHNENIALQKKHHEEQLLLQKENRDMQERHFVQQQKIQTIIVDNQYVDTRSIINEHYLSRDGKTQIDSVLSDEQKEIYEKSMTRTRARKAQEAEIARAKAEAEARRKAEEAKKNAWWQ